MTIEEVKHVLEHCAGGELEAEYLRNEGEFCPICRSQEVEGSYRAFDSGMAVMGVGCRDCGSRWEDLYSLTGIRILRNPKVPIPEKEL